jgi:hypothetical protein
MSAAKTRPESPAEPPEADSGTGDARAAMVDALRTAQTALLAAADAVEVYTAAEVWPPAGGERVITDLARRVALARFRPTYYLIEVSRSRRGLMAAQHDAALLDEVGDPPLAS